MRRVLALVMSFLLAASLGFGGVAHASEPFACIDATSAQVFDHAQGDGDEVPADTGKDYPHHHGGCHGHHIGTPLVATSLTSTLPSRPASLSWSHDRTQGTTIDPALRPPQA